MSDKTKKNWMAIRKSGITNALEVAYNLGLTGFCVVSREGKKIVLKEGGTFTEFVSCSYLGLETHPALTDAACVAMKKSGLHLSSSRGAMHPIYLPQLEGLLGDIYKGCAVGVFTSTSSVHLGVLPLLGSRLLKGYSVKKRVHWLIDKTAHASMQVLRGVLEQFGTVSRVESTNYASLDEALDRCIEEEETPVLLVDGVGSMSGLIPITELSRKLQRASGFVYVDDAHGVSITGEHGSGYAFSAVNNVLPENMIIAGSLSKAFGGSGGFVVMSKSQDIEAVKILANPIVFGHSIMLPMLAANVAAAKIHLSAEIYDMQKSLWENISLFDFLTNNKLINAGIRSPVRGLYFETEVAGLEAASVLREHNILAFPVFYPIIAKGKAMLRFAVSSIHSTEDIRKLAGVLEDLFILKTNSRE